jgi:hypothetical protein
MSMNDNDNDPFTDPGGSSATGSRKKKVRVWVALNDPIDDTFEGDYISQLLREAVIWTRRANEA